MTPFDCWWKIYPNKPHARKSHKEKKCRPLFDSFDLDIQRLIYRDTTQRRRSDSWCKGFYPAPLVYLRAEPWLDPIEFNDSVWDTTRETDNPAQAAQGLRRLHEMIDRDAENKLLRIG